MKMQPVLALLAEGFLDTDYGRFKMSVFHDGHEQAVVLSTGELQGHDAVICRIHSECVSSHVFLGRICDCREQMARSQKMIQDNGKGIIIYLSGQEGRGCGAAAHVATLDLKEKGISQPEAYKLRGFPDDIRRFDISAKILLYLQINSVMLISSNKIKIKTLEKFGIKVVGTKNLEGSLTLLGKTKNNIVDYIQTGVHKPIINKTENKKWILVIGDLGVDYVVSQKDFIDQIIDKPAPLIGGTGFNAAKIFKEKGFEPIIFGKIGDDREGRLVQEELEKRNITSLISIDYHKHTGNYFILFLQDKGQRLLIKEEENNANDYDIDNLEQTINLSAVGIGDITFIVSHALVRYGADHLKKMIDRISKTGAKIILDIVPHNIYEKVNLDSFKYAIGNNINVLISEYHTLMKIIGHKNIKERPDCNDFKELFSIFNVNIFVIRFGFGNCSEQIICKKIVHTNMPDNLENELLDEKIIDLRRILESRFNESDIRTICFDLNIDYDSIQGEQKRDKILYLLSYLKQRNCISEIIRVIKSERPDISLDHILQHISISEFQCYEIVEEKETGYKELPSDEKKGL